MYKRQAGLTNATGRVGDATQLGEIPDDSFDVVCCFGPLYHLPPEERELVFAECRRVCRPGGVLAFAYICQIGVYAAACVLSLIHIYQQGVHMRQSLEPPFSHVQQPAAFRDEQRPVEQAPDDEGDVCLLYTSHAGKGGTYPGRSGVFTTNP